jgi:hypothetical protein
MDHKPPYLTVVSDQTPSPEDLEFVPLPAYPWDERPPTLPVETDEAATALHLAHGDEADAAALLKIPVLRLQRLVRQSPRLARIRDESLQVALAKAASLPIRTLFDPMADRRAQEWASTKILQSKLAQTHPLSPAPPQSAQSASLTVNPERQSITFRWRTADDPDPNAPLIENEPPDDAS